MGHGDSLSYFILSCYRPTVNEDHVYEICVFATNYPECLLAVKRNYKIPKRLIVE